MKKKTTSKPTRKPRAPRKSLMQKVVEALEKSHPGRVDSGVLSDLSCAWVNVKKGDVSTGGAIILEIQFDAKGEEMLKIELAREIVAVVDQQIIFSTQVKQKKE